MELKLTRPICFFDLETTGPMLQRPIVEISILKVYPNGNKESRTWLVNPEMPIPEHSTAIHGISDEKVANEPTFKQLSRDIYNMIKDSDLAGYNSNRFDIPLLAEEMLRAEVDFEMKNRLAVDVQTIFHTMESERWKPLINFIAIKHWKMPIPQRRIPQLPMKCSNHSSTGTRIWKTTSNSSPNLQRVNKLWILQDISPITKTGQRSFPSGNTKEDWSKKYWIRNPVISDGCSMPISPCIPKKY